MRLRCLCCAEPTPPALDASLNMLGFFSSAQDSSPRGGATVNVGGGGCCCCDCCCCSGSLYGNKGFPVIPEQRWQAKRITTSMISKITIVDMPIQRLAWPPMSDIKSVHWNMGKRFTGYPNWSFATRRHSWDPPVLVYFLFLELKHIRTRASSVAALNSPGLTPCF